MLASSVLGSVGRPLLPTAAADRLKDQPRTDGDRLRRVDSNDLPETAAPSRADASLRVTICRGGQALLRRRVAELFGVLPPLPPRMPGADNWGLVDAGVVGFDHADFAGFKRFVRGRL
jgi:hypothetical protein